MAANAIAAAARARTFIKYRLVMVFRVDLMVDCLVPVVFCSRELQTAKSKRRANFHFPPNPAAHRMILPTPVPVDSKANDSGMGPGCETPKKFRFPLAKSGNPR
jgi:hypothetical protein